MRTLPLLVAASAVVLAGAGWLLWSTSDPAPARAVAGQGTRPLAPGGGPARPEVSLGRPDEEPGGGAQRQAQAPAPRSAPVAPPRPEPAAVEDPHLRGRVVDPFGSPIEGAEVVAYAIPPQVGEFAASGMAGMARSFSRAGKSEDTESGEDGRFSVEVPALERELEVDVKLRGHVVTTLQVGRPSELPVDLGDVTLVRGCVVAGRVVDEGGRPLAGAEVSLEREGEEDPMGLERLGMGFGPRGPRTAADGRFEFEHEPAGEFELLVTHKQRPTVRRAASAREGDVLDLTVEMPAGGTIAGRVEGAPEDLKGMIVQARRLTREEGDVPDGEGMLGEVFAEMGMSTGDTWTRVRDGEFELSGLEPSGRYAVWVAAPHRQMFMREACSEEVEADVGEREVLLRYAPGASLAVQVLDAESGRPVREYEVLSRLGSGNLPARRDEVQDDQGRFTLTNLRPRGSAAKMQLLVRAVGYRTHRDEVVVTAAGEQALPAVYLHPAPVVRVSVTDSRGRPLEGATVWLAPDDTDFQRLAMAGRSFGNMALVDIDDEEDRTPRSGTTDEEGRVTLSSMPGVSAALTVRGDGHAMYREALALPLTGDLDHDVALNLGGGVELTVVDSDGFAAAKAGVEHRAGEEVGGLRGNYMVDDTGRLVLDHLAPGEHTFRPVPPGRQAFGGGPRGPRSRRGSSAGGEWVTVTVYEGETEELTLELPEFGVLSGRITEGGRPLTDARLTLLPDQGEGDDDVVVEGIEGFLATATDSTDERGVYQMVDVPLGEYVLRVRHPDRIMPSEARIEVTGDDTVLDMDLEVTGVQGRIVGAGGEPVVDAEVSAVPASEAGSARVGLGFLFGGSERPSVRTDEDGRFELRGLTVGEEVVVRAEAAWHSPATSPSMVLAEGELREDVDLVLEPAGALEVEITGGGMFTRVRLSLQGVEPSAAGDAEPVRPVTRVAISRRGKASFEDLQPGTWTVNVDGEERGTVEIEAGRQAAFRVVLEED